MLTILCWLGWTWLALCRSPVSELLVGRQRSLQSAPITPSFLAASSALLLKKSDRGILVSAWPALWLHFQTELSAGRLPRWHRLCWFPQRSVFFFWRWLCKFCRCMHCMHCICNRSFINDMAWALRTFLFIYSGCWSHSPLLYNLMFYVWRQTCSC